MCSAHNSLVVSADEQGQCNFFVVVEKHRIFEEYEERDNYFSSRMDCFYFDVRLHGASWHAKCCRRKR